MKVKGIQLYNYRNFNNEIVTFSDGINLICGDNAQGKTNLLEGLYLISTTKSHRGNKDSEITKFDTTGYMVKTKIIKDGEEIKITIGYDKSLNKKRLKVNDVEKKKLAEFMGTLNVVLFHPDDLQLVKGGPSLRRRFLDEEISQIHPAYYQQLLDYNKILAQRNVVLKEGRFNKNKLKLLPVMNIQLVELGSKIIKRRMEIIRKLIPLSRLMYRKISNDNDNFTIAYKCFIEDLENSDTVEIVAEKFNRQLSKVEGDEVQRGVSLVGPQRDDLDIKINDIDVKTFGSQGQQRTSVLALKMSELELIKSEIGEYPVLLLDDVFSELDQKKRRKIIDIVKSNNVQTFITETDFEDYENIKEEPRIIVAGGKVMKK